MAREDFKPKKGGKGNLLLSPATLAKLQEAAARPEVRMDESQFIREERAGRVHYRLRQSGQDARGKGGAVPPFLLSRSAEGARIYRGGLEWSVSTLHYEREDEKNHLTGQDPIPGIIRTLPEPWNASASDAGDDWQQLDWFGDVYLEWLVDVETCEVTECRISGPDEPDLSPIPQLGEDLTRDSSGSGSPAGYYLRIGSVPEEGDILQDRTGNVHWAVTFIPEAPVSSESSSGSSSSSSAPSSSAASSSASSSAASSGTDKSSNAIVPAPWEKDGYCALATVESDKVRFEFLAVDVPLTGRRTLWRIDPRWLALCEPGSLRVDAAPCADRPIPVSATVTGTTVQLRTWPLLRPSRVTFRLSGIRLGFPDWNLPPRTREQFEANERSLQAMYPR